MSYVFSLQSLLFSLSFSLNYRFLLPSSFTIILSFFSIDPCVGLGTVSFFLFYTTLLHHILETDTHTPFSILNSFYSFTHVSLLFLSSFICYPLGNGPLRVYFLFFYIPPAFTQSSLWSLLLSSLMVTLFI